MASDLLKEGGTNVPPLCIGVQAFIRKPDRLTIILIIAQS